MSTGNGNAGGGGSEESGRVVVFMSGAGRTLTNLHAASVDGRLHARIVGVVCSTPPGSGGWNRAVELMGEECVAYLPGHPTAEQVWPWLDRWCPASSCPSGSLAIPPIIALAGYLKRFPALRSHDRFVPADVAEEGRLNTFATRSGGAGGAGRAVEGPLRSHADHHEVRKPVVVNIHPGLLPRFGGPGMYGRRVHEEVLASGVSESGCTVHRVEGGDEYDSGRVLLERRCPVLAGDTPESLAARVFALEGPAYVEAINMVVHELKGRG